MVKEDIWTVEVTVKLEVPKEMVDDVDKLSKDLDGEFVKVKGGCYENAAFGHITNVGKINSETRTWE